MFFFNNTADYTVSSPTDCYNWKQVDATKDVHMGGGQPIDFRDDIMNQNMQNLCNTVKNSWQKSVFMFLY